MKYIIISPYSKPLRNGSKDHPKNYGRWNEFIDLFRKNYPEVSIFQIGTPSEERLNVDDAFIGLSFKELLPILKGAECWFSVDNFLQHFCSYHKIPGVAVYTVSSPKLFGYEENINVLKGMEYMRPDQFRLWEDAKYREDSFVEPSKILMAYRKHLDLHKRSG